MIALPPAPWRLIAERVCAEHRVSLAAVLGRSMHHRIVKCRLAVHYGIYAETSLSLPAMGRRLNRDHSTVLSNVHAYAEKTGMSLSRPEQQIVEESQTVIDPDAIHGRAADIVAAFVSNNVIQPDTIPNMIRDVHAALVIAACRDVSSVSTQNPAVAVFESITDEYLISLENGKRYRSLKPHLRALGLSPEGYRKKWGLPGSYPMTAPALTRQQASNTEHMRAARSAKAAARPK